MDTLPPPKRLKVLFVDDEENVLRSLRRLLMDEDFEVLTADSGREGLEIISENDIAVVMSDQRMPGMRGTEFLEHVRRLAPDAVRLVLTGYADVNAAVDAINRGGVYQYIAKPWRNDDLILSVRAAAERFRLVRENKYLNELTGKQNEELRKWTSELEIDVQQQSIDLTRKNVELHELNKRLENDFKGFIITISNLIELRDRTVANHSNNVAIISRKIAQKMKLDGNLTQDIAIAAQLHDIGKIGISDKVLLKDVESMAPFEVREYQTHSIRGQAVLDSNELLHEAGILIRYHHESCDGQGFPEGLRGEEIPLGSRIIAVADKYDRLLVTHPVKAALERMSLLSGTQFDPALYQILAEIAREKTNLVQPLDGAVESEIHPDELLSGMIVSRDVRSGTGVLLLPRGQTLSPRKIDVIIRYYRLDPPDTGVYVWVQGKRK